MNTNNNQIQPVRSDNALYPEMNFVPTIKEFCTACYRKLLAQISKTKDGLFQEFRQRFGAHEQMLRLALNEAEALAWQTGFPNLIFPELALEKAHAAAEWEHRQEILKQGTSRASRHVFA